MTAIPFTRVAVLIVVSSLVGGPVLAGRTMKARKLIRIGEREMKAGRVDEAERYFLRAVAAAPGAVAAHVQLGHIAMVRQDWPEAIERYRTAKQVTIAELERRHAEQLDRAWRSADLARSHRDRLAAYQRAGRRGPIAIEGMARLEQQITELDASRGAPLDAAESYPAELSFFLGNAYFRNGEPERARAELEATLERDPDFGEAHANLAVLAYLDGRLELAWHHVDRARERGAAIAPRFVAELNERAPRGPARPVARIAAAE